MQQMVATILALEAYMFSRMRMGDRTTDMQHSKPEGQQQERNSHPTATPSFFPSIG